MKKSDTTSIAYVQLEKRLCLECGDEISYGRIDRKFCSEKCRYSHNNHLARASKIGRARTISKLDHNYSILLSLLQQQVHEIGILQPASWDSVLPT